MSSKAESNTETTTVPVEQRAAQALGFEETRKYLRELAAESKTLVAVDTDDNLLAAKAAKKTLTTARTSVEKTGKAARDDATALNKAIIAKERELISEIQPEETRLGTLIEAEDLRRAEALRAVREAEERRAKAIAEAFARVRSLTQQAVNATIEKIDELIAEAEKLRADPSHLPPEMHAAAVYEANVAITGCKAARDRVLQAHAEAEELARLRREATARDEELAKLKREAAERDAADAKAKVAAEADQLAAKKSEQLAAQPAPDEEEKPADDDDLPPPGIEPQFAKPAPPARRFDMPVPERVTVPVRRVLPLLEAARAAHKLLLGSQMLRNHPDTIALGEAIDEADVPGADHG